MNPLAWIGMNATLILAIGVFFGLFAPNLEHILPPFLPVLIFIFTVLSLVKADLRSIVSSVRSSTTVVVLLTWMLVVAPIAVIVLTGLIGLDAKLEVAIAIWAASPPMTAAIIFTALLGLDVTLATVICLLGLLIVPITGPLIGTIFERFQIELSAVELIGKSLIFVGAAFLVARLIRSAIGYQRLHRYAREFNGINVAILLIYVAALMSSVRTDVLSRPYFTTFYIVIASVLNLTFQAITYFLLIKYSPAVRTTAAILAGNRSMGILYANLGPAITPDLLLFFAATHIPIYTFPRLLRPLYLRVVERGTGT